MLPSGSLRQAFGNNPVFSAGAGGRFQGGAGGGPEPLFICSTWSFGRLCSSSTSHCLLSITTSPLSSEPLLYICSQHLPRKPCCSFLLPWHEFSVIYPISPLSDFVLEIPSPIQLSICIHTYKNTHTHKHTPHPISSPL